MTKESIQFPLPLKELSVPEGRGSRMLGNDKNSVAAKDRPIHDWYRFVLSFPPRLVRHYLEEFGLTDGATVLDPFCGTGTTVVEAKLRAFRAIGIEANPFPHFASCVKTDWRVNPALLLEKAAEIGRSTQLVLSQQGIDDRIPCETGSSALRRLPDAAANVLIKDSISPLPLHKILVLLERINFHQDDVEHKHLVLALGNALK